MIKFTKVRWKNFLSTGSQFIEVDLNRSTSTLIVGENGAGKSTILDAICFALFGKPFRSINKPQLINSINDKNCVVEIFFSIGRKEYGITRGIKPTVFEIRCDGDILNQDAASRDYQKILEDQILKLNYKSFTQIVILGSASFTPFMQLPPAHRREIIEDILDIQIFTVMNSVLKDKLTAIKDTIKGLEDKIELGKQKVKIQQEYLKKLEEDFKKRNEDIQTNIREIQTNIETLSTACQGKQEEYNALADQVKDESETVNRRTDLLGLYRSLQERIQKAKSDIEFYETNDSCPTCAQGISSDVKTNAIHKHTHRKEEVSVALDEISSRIQSIETRIDEILGIKEQMADLQSDIMELNSKIISEQNFIKKLQNDAQHTNSNDHSIKDTKQDLKQLAREVIDFSEQKSQHSQEKFYHEAAGSLLKDTGIKTKIIRQYLPVINKLVNKYLAAMDFFVSFELDETFKEVIKSRHRDDFSYASFSEGEKQRIDLALLFTWRTIAKMKNSASTNLLILDEVFDNSLDSNGTDYVMNLLNTLGEDTNTFVISHRGDQLFDKFRSLIKFEKHQNFSQIKL